MPDANYPQRLTLGVSPPSIIPLSTRGLARSLRMSGNAAGPLHVQNVGLPALNDEELSGLIEIGAEPPRDQAEHRSPASGAPNPRSRPNRRPKPA